MEELDHQPPQPKPGPNQDYSDSSRYPYAGIRQQSVFIHIVSRSKSVPKGGRGASKVVYNDETKILLFMLKELVRYFLPLNFHLEGD